jgi:hypothetical protein
MFDYRIRYSWNYRMGDRITPPKKQKSGHVKRWPEMCSIGDEIEELKYELIVVLRLVAILWVVFHSWVPGGPTQANLQVK